MLRLKSWRQKDIVEIKINSHHFSVLVKFDDLAEWIKTLGAKLLHYNIDQQYSIKFRILKVLPILWGTVGPWAG